MSVYPTFLNEKLADYILENFSSEDRFLQRLREESERLGFPRISISGDQGAFLQFFLTVINAKNVLEIGSLAGYSAITMAKALPKKSRLICLEKNKEYSQFIKTKAEEADLDSIIEVKNAEAKDFLDGYEPPEPFDFVFIDADKSSYIEYVNLTAPMIRKGGVLAADNALAFGNVADSPPMEREGEVADIQAFNNFFRKDFRFISSLVPVGDGLLMGVKIL